MGYAIGYAYLRILEILCDTLCFFTEISELGPRSLSVGYTFCVLRLAKLLNNRSFVSIVGDDLFDDLVFSPNLFVCQSVVVKLYIIDGIPSDAFSIERYIFTLTCGSEDGLYRPKHVVQLYVN
jgi:hypothetical protein